ncbi:DMT family transporter [Streptomyces acidiscabies]|uniref:Membrane protein n=1 Tax=Streptomyces acidiscabies TaxID=42234 RepID=A0A0L0JGS6_9ACTN|nr:DMT family transporter [Streptomyces acidiscabies]KND24881.1 membrane protein [Streptomyces acidiscabies]
MNATLVAVVLSLFSAVAYAAAAVAQERLASRSSGAGIMRMVRRGAWWGSVLLNGGGALLHVVALNYGPLTVVQPLGALTLVAAVPLGARIAGRKVSRAEWRGTSYTLAGLAAILVVASGPAPERTLDGAQSIAVASATVAVIAFLAKPGAKPGLRHATASGIASGVASALTQTVTVALTDTGSLPLYQVLGIALLVAAFATAGLLLSQTAYQDGLGAPLSMVTLSNPVAAAVIGLTLLGESLQGGAGGILVAAAGAGLAGRGVVLLSRATPEGAGSGVQDSDRYEDVERTGEVAHDDGVPGDIVVPDHIALPEPAGVPHDEHPVAAVLALRPESASQEPAMLPRPTTGPGQLTAL